MEREEIALLAVCFLGQCLAETGRGEPRWKEVGEAATLVHFPRENQLRYFKEWQDQGFLGEQYGDVRRCELTASGHHLAQSYLNFRPR